MALERQVFATSSADWPTQKAMLEAQIAAYHIELEGAETIQRAAYIQGEIAALRWLIAAAEPEFTPGVGHARYS